MSDPSTKSDIELKIEELERLTSEIESSNDAGLLDKLERVEKKTKESIDLLR